MSEKINWVKANTPDDRLLPGDGCLVTGIGMPHEVWVRRRDYDGILITFKVKTNEPAFIINNRRFEFPYADLDIIQKINDVHIESSKMGYKAALEDMRSIIDSMLEKFK